MKLLVKRSVLMLAMTGLSLSSLQAQTPTNVQEIRNELGIMLNILQASLKQNNNKHVKFRADSVTYLANQGVVFNIDSNNHSNFFSFDLGDMLNNLAIAPLAPVAPAAPKATKSQRIEIDIDHEGIEESIREAFAIQEDYVDENRDKMRELSERQRDLAWEQREYERNRRDLEFEKRNAENERRKTIDEEMRKLSAELAKIETKRAEIEKYTNELVAEQKKVVAEQEAAKKAIYQQSLAIFEETAGNMLCRYGAGLKALPENENISFVLNDFVDADKDSALRSHDKVYVFKYKEVKNCVVGKLTQEKLLSSATTYLF